MNKYEPSEAEEGSLSEFVKFAQAQGAAWPKLTTPEEFAADLERAARMAPLLGFTRPPLPSEEA